MTLRDTPSPEHVRVLDSVTEYRGAIFDILDEKIEFASGETAQRQFMQHDDAVAIVALRPGPSGAGLGSEAGFGSGADATGGGVVVDPEILLIKQYRHAAKRRLWEIPAGLKDVAGEGSLASAQRELAEEAELAGGRWFKLASFMASPGCSTEDVDVLLALDLEPAPGDFVREAEEAEIEVAWFALSDVVDAVLAGELHSPTLVIGVLAAKAALERGLENLVEA